MISRRRRRAATGPRYKIVGNGDSWGSGYLEAGAIDHGIVSHLDAAAAAVQAQMSNVSYVNLAIAGTRLMTEPTGAPTKLRSAAREALIAAQYDSSRICIYVCDVGRNDLFDRVRGDGQASGLTIAQIVAGLKTHMQNVAAMGFITVFCLPVPHVSAPGGDTTTYNNLIEADTTIASYFAPLYYHPVISDSRNQGSSFYFQSGSNSHMNAVGYAILADGLTPVLISALNQRTRPTYRLVNITNMNTLAAGATNASWNTTRGTGNTPATNATRYILGHVATTPPDMYTGSQTVGEVDFSPEPDTETVIGALMGVTPITGSGTNANDVTIQVRPFNWGAVYDGSDWVDGVNTLPNLDICFAHKISTYGAWTTGQGRRYFAPTSKALTNLSLSAVSRFVFHSHLLASSTPPGTNVTPQYQILSGTASDNQVLGIFQPP